MLILIEIFDGEFKGVNRFEDGNSVEGFLNSIAYCDRIAIVLVLPVIKYLPFQERIFRQGGDFVSDFEIHKVL